MLSCLILFLSSAKPGAQAVETRAPALSPRTMSLTRTRPESSAEDPHVPSHSITSEQPGWPSGNLGQLNPKVYWLIARFLCFHFIFYCNDLIDSDRQVWGILEIWKERVALVISLSSESFSCGSSFTSQSLRFTDEKRRHGYQCTAISTQYFVHSYQ